MVGPSPTMTDVDLSCYAAVSSGCTMPRRRACNAGVCLQRARAAFVGDLTVDQHVGAIDDRQHGFGVVLHDDHGDASAQAHQRVHHLLHNRWRQTLERFVEQDQPAGHRQGAGDREHLALAARQTFRTCALQDLQLREQCEDLVE